MLLGSSHCIDFAGETMLRTTLLESLWAEVRLAHATWLKDPSLAQHLTLALDGWSNALMESIYSFNVVFPDRRTILLKTMDLSDLTHSGENLGGICCCHAESAQMACSSAFICRLTDVFMTIMIVAEIVIGIMEEYGPRKFVALVTDNPWSMQKLRRVVTAKFPHVIGVR